MTNTRIPSFLDVARMVVPNGMPTWLPHHLEWWAQEIRCDRIIDEIHPSTLQARQRLAAVAEAARLIEKELDSPPIRELLAAVDPMSLARVSRWEMKRLAERADAASESPLLVSAQGKTKRGRGKPKIPNLFDAKALCASRIWELWRFFRKEIPGIGNLEAAAAAHAYWLASGGTSDGYGNPLNGWYDYFKIVRDKSGSPGLKQLIWWRDLEQAKRRGGPPWYWGSCFPILEEEIRSPIPAQ